MSDLMTLAEAGTFIRNTRSDLDQLQAELASIPAAIETAKRDGDAREIRRLKARETELHSLILDEAGRARAALYDRQQAELKPRDARRAELTGAADQARQALAATEADCKRRIETARTELTSAEKALAGFLTERQHIAAELAAAMDDFRAAVAASADYV